MLFFLGGEERTVIIRPWITFSRYWQHFKNAVHKKLSRIQAFCRGVGGVGWGGSGGGGGGGVGVSNTRKSF